MEEKKLFEYVGLFGETAEGDYFVVTYNPMVDDIVAVYKSGGWDLLKDILEDEEEVDYVTCMKKTYSFETYLYDKRTNRFEIIYKQPKKMTKEMIEEELGYEIKIVDHL